MNAAHNKLSVRSLCDSHNEPCFTKFYSYSLGGNFVVDAMALITLRSSVTAVTSNNCCNLLPEENVVSNGQWTPLQRFLVSAGVEEYAPQLMAQRIDLDAVLMLSDADLIELGKFIF